MMTRARAVASAPLGWFSEAKLAFRQARFADAAELIAAAERSREFSGAAALLRARILLKREPAAALEALARSRSILREPAARAEGDLLTGAAYARLGDAAAARARFDTVEAFAPPQSPLAAELGYQRALALWIERRLDEAESVLDAAEPCARDSLLVECRVLRGSIAASRGDITRQAAILLDTLVLVREADASVLHHAVVASQVAYLARELPSAELRANAFSELPRVAWTADIAEFEYTALRAVAWCHALEGDYFNAFRKLKEAAAVAPSRAWQVMSSCDRAYLATALREVRWAEQELRDAHELAASIEWNVCEGEERFALSLLAELFAPRDPAVALSYVGKYRATGKRYARILSSRDDRRVDAMEAFSFGIVQRHLGEPQEAARLMSEAWSIYDAIGYDWRAGRAALVLSELTDDATWRSRGLEKLNFYTRSWLVDGQPVSASRRVANPGPPIDTAGLTPAQRSVFELLVCGWSTKRIAAELGRTENTVRNHIKAVFKSCGVRSRAALIARTMRA